MQAQPYLLFNGCCEDAMEFYRKALGAQVEVMMRFKDSPEPPPPEVAPTDWGDKIMHASLRIGDTALMASDYCGGCGGAGNGKDSANFGGFSIALDPVGQSDAERIFEALADGGSVQMPLTKTFWSPCFGTLTDRFGVGWMVSAVD